MSKKKALADQYQDHLPRIGKSPQMVEAYSYDLAAFARWFEQTSGEDFDPGEIQEYKGYC